mmetsp:Transcript_50009/g.106412  ORF Transcript_50009/g.106412 Transcript_50009/m.106412 type:complete len:84 (+) Transcript_50009:1045-1296(+)
MLVEMAERREGMKKRISEMEDELARRRREEMTQTRNEKKRTTNWGKTKVRGRGDVALPQWGVEFGVPAEMEGETQGEGTNWFD